MSLIPTSLILSPQSPLSPTKTMVTMEMEATSSMSHKTQIHRSTSDPPPAIIASPPVVVVTVVSLAVVVVIMN